MHQDPGCEKYLCTDMLLEAVCDGSKTSPLAIMWAFQALAWKIKVPRLGLARPFPHVASSAEPHTVGRE